MYGKDKIRNNMMPFEKCPVCGGELVEKEIEEPLRGGVNVAVIKVLAEVCLHCGEHLYSQETVRRFEEIRASRGGGFSPLGQSFQVA